MERDSTARLPLFSGRLDGTHLQGASSLDALYVNSGSHLLIELSACHPCVEWQQRYTVTPLWSHAPIAFPARRKARVEFALRALGTHEPLPGVRVLVDMRRLPRPPPPEPTVWEWGESVEAYCVRLLVPPRALHEPCRTTWSRAVLA